MSPPRLQGGTSPNVPGASERALQMSGSNFPRRLINQYHQRCSKAPHRQKLLKPLHGHSVTDVLYQLNPGGWPRLIILAIGGSGLFAEILLSGFIWRLFHYNAALVHRQRAEKLGISRPCVKRWHKFSSSFNKVTCAPRARCHQHPNASNICRKPTAPA